MNAKENEVVINVGRIFSEKGQDWLPTIQILAPHDHHPAWTAALMYLLLDKYLATVDDSKQEEYAEETLRWLKLMRDNAHEYIDKVESADEVE